MAPKDKEVDDDELRPRWPSPVDQVQKVDAERARKEAEERRNVEKKERGDG